MAYDDAVVCRTDGSVVPTVTMSCPRELQERYLGLLEGSESYRCGQTLAQMPEVKLYGLLTELTVERLERKYNDFLSLYRETGNDWNETFYVMLFRTMGARIEPRALHEAGANGTLYGPVQSARVRRVGRSPAAGRRRTVAADRVSRPLHGHATAGIPPFVPSVRDRADAPQGMESRQSQSASRPAAADRRAGRPALLAGVHVLPTARLPHAGTSERDSLGAGVGVLDHPLSARTAQPVQRQVVRRHDARPI